MYDSAERFGEEVGRVFDTWDVVDVDKSLVDGVTNEVGTYVYVFHSGVRLRIMSAYYGALVVAIKWGGVCLGEAEFVKQGTEPKAGARAVGAC